MSSAAFILNIIFSSIITLIFLYRCGNFRRQHPITTIAVFISWLFSALFIFVLPLDISHTTYLDCSSKNETCPEPWSNIDSKVYQGLWNVVYWTSQLLTWLILPFMQSFGDTGEFSIKGKIKYTLKVNLIYYGTLLLIFVIFLIILISKYPVNSSNFTGTLTAASTTWGLVLVVLLLGYGLVRMPLNIYNHSRAGFMLGELQFQLSQLYNEKVDVEEKLDSLIDELTKFCMQIKPNNPLRPCLNQIIKIVPERYSNRIELTVEDFENNRIVLTNQFADPDIESRLVKLHERLKTNIHIHHRVQTYWTQKIDEAFYYEDINSNIINPERRFLRQTPFPSSWLRRKLFDNHPRLEWYTFCFLRPWSIRILGIILGLISLIVMWSEVTFSISKPTLSIFALIVDSARVHHDYFTIEVFCCLSIAYMCACAYYTMFRIRVFNYFYLSLYHLTDENSLVYAATFLSRLTAPLCYNFLGMIHMDQAITKEISRHQTVFTDIMGHMTVIPLISDGFYIYFPILICLLGIGTFFRLGSRCLHAFGYRQFFDDDEQSAEYVEDGKALMRRERRNFGGLDTLSSATTAAQRQDRRRELEQKYGLRSASAMASNNTLTRSKSDNSSETRPLMSENDETSESNNRDLLPEVYPQTTTGYEAI